MKVTQSCLTLCNPMDYTIHGILQVRILKWIAFPFSRESSEPRDQNSGLPHWRQILYQLSHKGSPRILEWVGYPFSSRSSRASNQTRVSCIAGRFFINWAIREDNLLNWQLYFMSALLVRQKWFHSLTKPTGVLACLNTYSVFEIQVKKRSLN